MGLSEQAVQDRLSQVLRVRARVEELTARRVASVTDRELPRPPDNPDATNSSNDNDAESMSAMHGNPTRRHGVSPVWTDEASSQEEPHWSPLRRYRRAHQPLRPS